MRKLVADKVAKDLATAESGCRSMHEPAACQEAAKMYESGAHESLPANPERRLELLLLGCEYGTPDDCNKVTAAKSSAVFHRKGKRGDGQAEIEFVALPTSLMLPALEKACDRGGQQACFELGALYLHGQDIPKDEARAVDIWGGACQWPSSRPPPFSSGQLKAAAEACSRLSNLHRSGRGAVKDEMLSLELGVLADEIALTADQVEQDEADALWIENRRRAIQEAERRAAYEAREQEREAREQERKAQMWAELGDRLSNLPAEIEKSNNLFGVKPRAQRSSPSVSSSSKQAPAPKPGGPAEEPVRTLDLPMPPDEHTKRNLSECVLEVAGKTWGRGPTQLEACNPAKARLSTLLSAYNFHGQIVRSRAIGECSCLRGPRYYECSVRGTATGPDPSKFGLPDVRGGGDGKPQCRS